MKRLGGAGGDTLEAGRGFVRDEEEQEEREDEEDGKLLPTPCGAERYEDGVLLLTADLLGDGERPRGIRICGSRKRASIGIAHHADSQHAAPEMIPFLAPQPTAVRAAAGSSVMLAARTESLAAPNARLNPDVRSAGGREMREFFIWNQTST